MNILNKPIILSIETSSNLSSITISDGKKYIYKELIGKENNSRFVLSIIKTMLFENKIHFTNIDFIALGNGPGSFTGVRLAFSISKALAIGWKIPILSISSLLALVYEICHIYKSKLLVLVQKEENIYWELYNQNLLNYKKISNVNEVKKIILKDKSIASIIFAENNIKNRFKKQYAFLNTNNNLYPKSIYVDYLARKALLNNRVNIITNLKHNYVNQSVYKKYKL